MSKIMLVNVTHVEESRVAIVEDGVLAGYEIETLNRAHIKGNIYNAVVEAVHPSLEAAFVRIGPDLKGFLPLDEVNFKLLPVRNESRKYGKIGMHLSQGQKLMVQVVREPFSGKPPTVSTYFSLPGRFLVLMPGVDSAGISRKIESLTQRDRLKKIIDELNAPDGFGVIVRTAGVDQTKTELQRDLRYLLRLWESVQRSSAATDFPGSVYSEADLVIRTIRDHFTPDIKEVWIDSSETYERAMTFMRNVMPTRAKTLQLYSGDRPLFNKHNLEEQIERIYKRRVPLPSGGEIVIDGTEALTAIDVNSARSRRGGDAEENVVQTNIEAAAEIARQLRLRHQGGLIVIDFIDMTATRNKTKVEKALKDAMKGDRAKYDMTRISKLGLVEIARQRIQGEKMSASYATCPSCDGYGLIKNVETAGLAALRKLQTRASRGGASLIRLVLAPEVATWMLNHKRSELLRIEQSQALTVEIVANAGLRRHETEFEAVPRERGDAAGSDVARSTGSSQTRRDIGSGRSRRESRPEPASGGRSREDTRVEPAHGGRSRGDVGGEPAKPTRSRRDGGDTDATVRSRADAARPAEESSQVLPFPAGASASEAESAEPRASEETGESAEGRPRRRRKRRRRGRGGAATDTNAAAPAEPDEEREQEALVVPKSVRSDELMPAAVGSASRKRGASSSGGRRKKASSGGARRKGRSRRDE